MATATDRVDCDSCIKKKIRPKCFYDSDTIKCKGQKIAEFEVDKNEWGKIIDKVQAIVPGYPEHLCFRHLGVCPLPIITELSFELLELYRACNGIHVSTPAEYYALPALYVRAANIIDGELNRIKSLQDKENDQK